MRPGPAHPPPHRSLSSREVAILWAGHLLSERKVWKRDHRPQRKCAQQGKEGEVGKGINCQL